MNGKKAKMLRRAAERLSVGNPAIEYHAGTFSGLNPRRLTQGCTRGHYQALKRIVRLSGGFK